MINKALSVDEEDVKTFKALEEHGVTFDVRIYLGTQEKISTPSYVKRT